ncbi:NAD(P)H-binding protein [Martelella endophytica]|uniref:NmrA family transcriptional regulator n=1 Tax=Martelella endophytica TaxID=1486262 RepID=A0A0D5LW09_MAREN|nr:NAD(P)H-binding protein [Martelella endophytica]AJY48429.1 NmrA family transcriptional regulator [Martelella endophytica]
MIVITAPTSRIGHQLLPLLLSAGASVRVIVRDAGKLPAEIRDRVDVIEGSHGDRATLDSALAGATRLFWLCPADPQAETLEAAYTGFTRPAAEAIVAHGVARVVNISALGRGTPYADRAGYVTASLAMDDQLAATGAHFRALALPSFMDNLLWQLPVMREKGMVFSSLPGDLELPTCSVSDIAAAAARLLLDDSWEGTGEVPVLGPENLSVNQQVEIMSAVLGKTIRAAHVSLKDQNAMLVGRGFSQAMADGMTDMWRAKAEGLDLGVERNAETASPTTFRAWCETTLKPAFAG